MAGVSPQRLYLNIVKIFDLNFVFAVWIFASARKFLQISLSGPGTEQRPSERGYAAG